MRDTAQAAGIYGDVLDGDREDLEELGVIGERVFGDLTGVLQRFVAGDKVEWQDFARVAVNALQDILQQMLSVRAAAGGGGLGGVLGDILGGIFGLCGGGGFNLVPSVSTFNLR